MVEMVISQTAHIKELKIEDIHITSHHSDCQTQPVNSKAFTIEGQSGQITGFMALLYMSISQLQDNH